MRNLKNRLLGWVFAAIVCLPFAVTFGRPCVCTDDRWGVTEYMCVSEGTYACCASGRFSSACAGMEKPCQSRSNGFYATVSPVVPASSPKK